MLKNNRITLLPLTILELEELRNNTYAAYSVSHDLLADTNFMRAIAIKIENMKKNDIDKHNWLTSWAIISNVDHKIIGFIGFKGYPQNGAVEVGYSLSTTYRQQGFMTEALQLLLVWTEESHLVKNVLADVLHTNVASNQLLLKCNFQLTHSDDELHYYSFEI